MAKNSFIFYTDYMEDLQDLEPEDFKTLMFALGCYQNEQGIPDMDPTLKCLFKMICRRIDHDNEAYEKTVQRNQTNGKKGGRPKTQHNPTEPKETQENPEEPTHNPTEPKKPELELGIGYGYISTTKVVDDIKGQIHQPLDEDFQRIKDAWNAIPFTQNIDAIAPMTKRYDEMRICIDMYGMDKILKAIQKVADSKWLSSRGSPATFKSFMNKDAIQGLLEGAYDEDYGTQRGGYTGELGIDWEAVEHDSSQLSSC